ncbi:MAG: RNA polymerase sigma factor [Steroidobacteraceae bacterium]
MAIGATLYVNARHLDTRHHDGAWRISLHRAFPIKMQGALRSFRWNMVVSEHSAPARTPVASGPDPVSNAQQALLTLLFNKYRGALFRHITRFVHSPEDAAELVQETYLRVMAHAQIREFESIAQAYLFRVASNLARDHLRRQRWRAHEPLESIPEPEAPPTSDSPEAMALWGDAMKSLEVALNAMPELTRSVFIRVRLDGHSYADIAHEFGIGVRTVERRMSEAMQVLTSRLAEIL